MYLLNLQIIFPTKVENKNLTLVAKDDYGCKNSTLEQKGISQKQKMIVDQQYRDIKVLYMGQYSLKFLLYWSSESFLFNFYLEIIFIDSIIGNEACSLNNKSWYAVHAVEVS